MNTLVVFAVFGLFGAAFGAESCCTPRQWEATLGEWGGAARERGHPALITETVFYAYDEVNQRVAAAVEIKDGFVRSVADYQEKKLYVIYGSHCKHYKLRQPFRRACTDNSTSLGSFSFGAGDESMKLNAWKVEVGDLKAIFSTTPRNCIPVTEAISGRIRREYFALTIGYVNVSLRIKDPRIFNVPSTCEPANWTDVDEHFEDLELSSSVSYMLKKTVQ